MPLQQVAPGLIVPSDLLGHVRFDDGGANGIHAHAFSRELQRYRFGETDHCELAGAL